MTTEIEWTDETWNPLRGCSRVSAGCVNCSAAREAWRHHGPGPASAGLVHWNSGGPKWTGAVRMITDKSIWHLLPIANG